MKGGALAAETPKAAVSAFVLVSGPSFGTGSSAGRVRPRGRRAKTSRLSQQGSHRDDHLVPAVA